MVFGRPELERGRFIEHGSSSMGRWLRARRVRLALWIAVVEGVLAVFDVIPWYAVVLAAAAAVLFYFGIGRSVRSDAVRQSSWIAAASQALVALVPALVVVVGTLALIAVALLALVALFALFSDRR